MASYIAQMQSLAVPGLLGPIHLVPYCGAQEQVLEVEEACYNNTGDQICHNYGQDYFHDQSQNHHYDQHDYYYGLVYSCCFPDPL